MRKIFEGECRDGLGQLRSLPESQGARKRELAIEREVIVRKCGLGPVDAAGAWVKQAGHQANQARLAAAVRSADMQRAAGFKFEIDAFEQEPTASDESKAFAIQERAHA